MALIAGQSQVTTTPTPYTPTNETPEPTAAQYTQQGPYPPNAGDQTNLSIDSEGQTWQLFVLAAVIAVIAVLIVGFVRSSLKSHQPPPPPPP